MSATARPAAEPPAIEWRRFGEFGAPLLYRLLQFRQAIFVVEQRCAYPDLDGLDALARHLLLWISGDLVGSLRLLPPATPDDGVKVGRVAVAPAARRRGLARLMMRKALRLAALEYSGRPVCVGAQAHLAPFYERLGFRRISEPYDDYGILHIDMRWRPSPSAD